MSLYIISLSLFIFLSFLYVSFKVFFEKKDSNIKNSLNILKFISISGLFTLFVYYIITFINSGSSIFLFNEIKEYFFIFLIAALYITIILSKFNESLVIDRYNNNIDDYFGLAYYLFIILSSTFISIEEESLLSKFFLAIGITIVILLIYEYTMSSYKSAYIYINLIAMTLIVIFLFINDYININFYFLIPMFFLIIFLRIYTYFIFNVKTKYFEKIIRNKINSLKYKTKIEKNCLFLNKFKLEEEINLKNVVLSFYNDKDDIKYFITINVKNLIFDTLKNNKLNIFLLNKLNGEFEISLKKIKFSYYKRNENKLEKIEQLNLLNESHDLEKTIKELVCINEISKY